MKRSLTLADLQQKHVNALKANNRSEKTITHYTDSYKDLVRFLTAEGLPLLLDSVTTDSCQRYVVWLRETPIKERMGTTRRSESGVAGRLRDLKAFLNYLIEYDFLDRKIKIPSPKAPAPDFTVFTDDELERIFACEQLTTRGTIAVRNRAIFLILLDSGIRLAEITGLGVEDVEMEDFLLKVCGKGRRTRRVPFSPTTALAIQAWLKVRQRGDGPLFELSYHGMRMLMLRVRNATGVHIHPHRFRHTAATKLVRAGKSSSVVRRLMGHASIATTEIYVNLTNADLREQHHGASPVESIAALMSPDKPKKKVISRT